MAKYVALLTGSGYGCDYTIGCNKNFEVFTANDESEAIKRCRQKWEDYYVALSLLTVQWGNA